MYDDDNIGTIADEPVGNDMAGNTAEGSGGVGGGEPVSGSQHADEGGVQGTIADVEGDAGAVSGNAQAQGADAGAQKAPQPEVYELQIDEKTFPMPKENLDSFTQTCREAGLTKAQAEKILGWHQGQYAATQTWAQQEQQRQIKEWNKNILEDRDFGGTNYKGTIADARKALAQFDPDGSLRALLKQTGGEHHPDVIRAIARVGRAMAEHGIVPANGGGGEQKEEPFWKRVYGPAEG